jgi:uncharacterized lipoprotein YajG
MKHFFTVTAVFLVFFGAFLFLTGCAAPETQIQTVVQTKVVTPQIPAALLTCMDEPPIPAMTLQSQAADLLVADDIAGEDCRLHLAAVKQALAAPPVAH